MCDYSLKHLASRPATIDDKLVVSKFSGSSSIGFTAGDNRSEAVCVLPGTELAFDDYISQGNSFVYYGDKLHDHKTARFRQINVENPYTHHDALELPDGQVILLHSLRVGQTVSVLQLPAAPKTEQEAKEQERLEVVG
jgi:hypothetical protein